MTKVDDCGSCISRYGFDVSTCGGNAAIAGERYGRLRRKDWLLQAAREIAKVRDSKGTGWSVEDEARLLVVILEKHRDAAALGEEIE